MMFKAKLKRFIRADSNLMAYGDITINNEIVLKKVAVMQKKDGSGIFVSYPSKKNEKSGEYEQFYYPITRESREALNNAVLEAYSALLEQEPE